MFIRVQTASLILSVLLVPAMLSGCSKGSTLAPDPTPPAAAPEIVCPVVPDVTSSTAVAVTFSPPTVTGGKAPVTTKCTPDTNTVFPVGTTPVNCTATDALARSASCAFTVKVSPPPQISLTRFVAFGDSLTWGDDGQNDQGATPLSIKPLVRVNTPYPERLRQLLVGRYTLQSGLFAVDNAGAPGEAAGKCNSPSDCPAVTRFGDVVVRSGARYDAVLIMEGSNDVNLIPGDFLAETRAISALTSMIEFAKGYNVRPYLATIPREDPNGDPTRVKGALYVQDFNNHLQVLAQTEGIPLVDIYGKIDASMISTDGLHLRQIGYDKVAQTFLEALEATAEFTTTSSVHTSRSR